MTPVVFLDTETTGLDPDRHDIWEIGAIVRNHPREDWNGEWLWQLPVDASKGEPTGLRIGHFYERYIIDDDRASLSRHPKDAKSTSQTQLAYCPRPSGVARILARLLNTAHIVGAVPSFDAAFLTRFLNRHEHAATWHYHLIDVEAMAVGHISARRSMGSTISSVRLPWKSDDLAAALGLDPTPENERHTALGDARWAMRMYDAMVGVS